MPGNGHIFISKENLKKFLIKLYNTSIHNFETLVNNKINPILDKKKFEKFIFMNIYMLWYLLCDRNKNILSDINSDIGILSTIPILPVKNLVISKLKLLFM